MSLFHVVLIVKYYGNFKLKVGICITKKKDNICFCNNNKVKCTYKYYIKIKIFKILGSKAPCGFTGFNPLKMNNIVCREIASCPSVDGL